MTVVLVLILFTVGVSSLIVNEIDNIQEKHPDRKDKDLFEDENK